MAKVKMDKNGVAEFFKGEEVKKILLDKGEIVQKKAESTAGQVQNISKDLIGYSGAGFETKYEKRSKRPRVTVSSKANPDLVWKAHFASQQVNGVAHLRAALYDSVGE